VHLPGLCDWSPVIDGVELTAHPTVLAAQGKFNKGIPVLLGTNAGPRYIRFQQASAPAVFYVYTFTSPSCRIYITPRVSSRLWSGLVLVMYYTAHLSLQTKAQHS
jgi:hypothetical protein